VSTPTLTRDRVERSPLMDPRLRARRIEVARGRGRRRLRGLVGLIVVLVLVAAALVVSRSALFSVQRIDVRGTSSSEASAVRKAVGVGSGESLVWVDADRVVRQVEALAWVDTASIKKVWPHTLVATVTPRTPVAIASGPRGPVLIDASGMALAPAGASRDVPDLDLDGAAVGDRVPQKFRPALVALAALPRDLSERVDTMSVDADGIGLELDGGIEVRFGDGNRVRAKAIALRALLDQADGSDIARIDVRVPSAPSLTWRQGRGPLTGQTDGGA